METDQKVESNQKKQSVTKNILHSGGRIIIILFGIFIFMLLLIFAYADLFPSDGPDCHGSICIRGGAEKPVIYLYPTITTDINVKLEYQGELIVDYPKYNEKINGWNVTAEPNGRLINSEDQKEYSYIFWEGIPREKINWDLSEGFVVKGEDTVDFLQKILPKLGLSPVEYNEFIVYWYPLMKNNTYNLIHFAGEQYTNTAPLDITPTPDSMLRVFMVYKPLEEYTEVEEQIIKPFERKGFSVIEWGGAIVD